MGQLKIVDGKIIACDPFLYNNDLPFSTTFPVGHFPVQLAVAKIDTDERVAFSRIKFADNKPVNWTMAWCRRRNRCIYGHVRWKGIGEIFFRATKQL
jgi:hypothetical protein